MVAIIERWQRAAAQVPPTIAQILRETLFEPTEKLRAEVRQEATPSRLVCNPVTRLMEPELVLYPADHAQAGQVVLNTKTGRPFEVMNPGYRPATHRGYREQMRHAGPGEE